MVVLAITSLEDSRVWDEGIWEIRVGLVRCIVDISLNLPVTVDRLGCFGLWGNDSTSTSTQHICSETVFEIL